MDTLNSFLQKKVSLAIQLAFSLPLEVCQADIALCAQEEFGHYQCNSALRLGHLLKDNPRVIAAKILDCFDASFCEKVEIAGPGFINFHFSLAFLSSELNQQLKDPLLGASLPHKKERVIVEFSSPNVAKELHVGHIRSTIIGDCLARIFEFLRYDVLRLNHIGDWGTQFGMLIAYLDTEILPLAETTSLEQLMDWYKQSKKRFDEDEVFKKYAQQQVVKLQSGDPKSIEIWKLICTISRRGFQAIYDLLGVSLIERGESFYNSELKGIVDEFQEKGLITVSQGAKCVFLEGFKNREGDSFPLMIQKSDGGYNYDTTDLAALKHRIFVEKADRIIIVTDLGQSLHFQMLFQAGEKIGWLKERKVVLDHVGFGLVLGPDGKKFKTRSGETEKLIDLLTEAVDRAYQIVKERMPDASESEQKKLASVLGLGAVKYADLSSHRTKDYTFSYERMLRFEGNTAVFLLYAYVRMLGIQRKTRFQLETLAEEKIVLGHPSEMALGLHLRRFGDVLELVAKELLPHRLTDYLYTLAEKFNAFFRDCRVEGSEEEKSRCLLVHLTAQVLKQGLSLLGLSTVEKM